MGKKRAVRYGLALNSLAVMAVALTDMSTMPSTFCVMASSRSEVFLL